MAYRAALRCVATGASWTRGRILESGGRIDADLCQRCNLGEVETDFHRALSCPANLNLAGCSASHRLRQAARATRDGVPRVHLIGSRNQDALLAELFSNEGVGTMIHADDYQQIHAASAADVPALLSMMKQYTEAEKGKPSCCFGQHPASLAAPRVHG